jgi:hypothetical protein
MLLLAATILYSTSSFGVHPLHVYDPTATTLRQTHLTSYIKKHILNVNFWRNLRMSPFSKTVRNSLLAFSAFSFVRVQQGFLPTCVSANNLRPIAARFLLRGLHRCSSCNGGQFIKNSSSPLSSIFLEAPNRIHNLQFGTDADSGCSTEILLGIPRQPLRIRKAICLCSLPL